MVVECGIDWALISRTNIMLETVESLVDDDSLDWYSLFCVFLVFAVPISKNSGPESSQGQVEKVTVCAGIIIKTLLQSSSYYSS